MGAQFARFIWPPVENGDYLTTARKRCLLVICFVSCAVGVWSGTRNFEESFDLYPLQTIIAIALPLVLLVCPIILAYTNNLRAVAIFFLAFTFVGLFAVPYLAGGMFSRGTLFMLPWAMLATLFLGWREGIVAAVVVFAAYLFFFLFDEYLPPSLYEIDEAMVKTWLFTGLTMTLFMLIGGAAIFQREMERAANKLSEAREAAEAAHRAKSDFLANISHEIRTPMNGILGMADMLEGTKLDERQKLFTQTINSSATSLLAVINDVLDLSQIEAGEQKLAENSIELKAFAQEMYDLYASHAHQKHLRFDMSISEGLPSKIMGDEAALRRILINLLSNAFKFTENGSVSLSFSGFVRGRELALTVDVADTGIGISHEQIEAIFESFAQAENSTTRRYDGAGAGLSISRLLARAMDGDVTVTSRPNKGSKFRLTVALPILDYESLRQMKLSTRSSANGLRRPIAKPNGANGKEKDAAPRSVRVLVAEDNEVNRLVLKHLLDTKTHSVTFAEDGLQAFQAYQEDTFDIILMDISMPNMDGYEAAKAIRAHEEENDLESTPIICVTAHTLEEHREKSLASGMNDYIPKPVGKENLLAKLNAWTTHNTLEDFVAPTARPH